MRIVLVESPFGQGDPKCIRYALWCLYDSIARGEAPFASHLFYTQVLPETPEGRALGLKMRDAFSMRAAVAVVKYTDLGVTKGMVREVDCTLPVEERKLEGAVRKAWLDGKWPAGSVRLACV